MSEKSFDYQKLYDRMAPFYAPAMRLLPMWRRYTEAVLPWLPGDGVILEIGPGPGLLLGQLAEHHPQVFGLDLSPGMLRTAQRHLGQTAILTPLSQGNVARLPFAANSFDGLTATFIFSAVPDGLAAMQEMARVLRPGGVLALVDAGVPSDGNLIGAALARMWEKFGDFMRDEAALMREAGLEIIERREFGAFNSIRLVVGRKSA